MPLKVPSAGENRLVERMLGKSTAGNLTLKLYVNNYTPVDASVAGDFTEMSTLGYSAKTLASATWNSASQSSSKGQITYADQTWTFTAGTAVTIYGYFVIDAADGVILWAEKFTTARVVQNAGDQLIITPIFTLSSES